MSTPYSTSALAHLIPSTTQLILDPYHLLHRTIMPGSSESQYIRLESESSILHSYLFHDPHTLPTVLNGNNLQLPSWRIPAGIYVSINLDSRRHWKSAISILSSDGVGPGEYCNSVKFMETFQRDAELIIDL